MYWPLRRYLHLVQTDDRFYWAIWICNGHLLGAPRKIVYAYSCRLKRSESHTASFLSEKEKYYCFLSSVRNVDKREQRLGFQAQTFWTELRHPSVRYHYLSNSCCNYPTVYYFPGSSILWVSTSVNKEAWGTPEFASSISKMFPSMLIQHYRMILSLTRSY